MKDFQKLIGQAIVNSLANPEQGAGDFARPTGSYALRDGNRLTGQEAADMLAGIADTGIFSEVTEQAVEMGAAFGKCRYFSGIFPPSIVGYQAAVIVGNLLTSELERVRVVEAMHRDPGGAIRYELVSDVAPMRTRGFHVIVGCGTNPFEEPTAENALVYSWYPGHLTPKVDVPAAAAEWTAGELGERLPLATVKLGVPNS